MNPWVVTWCRVHGIPLSSLFEEDSRYVLLNGERLPWGVHYSIWIRAQWAAWAKELGYATSPAALLCGRRPTEFASWLQERWSKPLGA